MNSTNSRNPGLFLIYWHKIGGGSLMLSLAVHAVLIVIAVLLIRESIVEHPQSFLAGGGNARATMASEQLHRDIKTKKHQRMNRETPLHRVVIDDPLTRMHVPQNTITDLPMPDTDP